MAVTKVEKRNTLFSGIWKLGRIKWYPAIIMLTACLVPLILLSAAKTLFDIPATNLSWLILLLSPLAHMLLMRKHN